MKSKIYFKQVNNYEALDLGEDNTSNFARIYTIESLKNPNALHEGKHYTATIGIEKDGTNFMDIQTVLNGSEYREQVKMKNFHLTKEPEYSETTRDVKVELEVLPDPDDSHVFNYQHRDYLPLFDIFMGS